MANLRTSFHVTELSELADSALPSETRSRIECIVKRFLASLVASKPSIEPLSLICRTERNTQLYEGAFGHGDNIYLSHAIYKKSFTRKHGQKTYYRGPHFKLKETGILHEIVNKRGWTAESSCAKIAEAVWKVLQICYELLGLGKKATQRELFYRLLSDSPDYIDSQTQVNDSIQDAVALLRCDRQSLGILASSRGAVVGRLLIEDPGGEVVDCSRLGPSAHVIRGDLHFKHQKFQSNARYILIVEKDAIFQRLAEDRFFQSVPSIILTAKGYPDLASRALLQQLHTSFPSLPILALVDWNPSGLAILCSFKFGSIRMGLEAPQYVCDVKWLGLRCHDIQACVPKEALLSLTDKDRKLGKSLLKSKMLQNHEDYRRELNDMLTSGHRAELQALYAHGYDFLGKFITHKLIHQDYI